jgi:hypothetical protein
MSRTFPALLVALGLVLAVGVAAAVGSSTSVTISTPRTGSTVSQKTTPYLAVAGNAAFASSGPTTTRYLLHRDDCGGANDNPHLSTTGGTDNGDGCGLLYNALVGLGGEFIQAAAIDFPATDALPLAFDASRQITGAISLTGAQVGAAEVDVTLEALVGGEAVSLGKATSDLTVLDPTADHTPVPFTITPDPAYNGADVQALDLRVLVRGPNVYSGYISLNGNSYVDLPTYAASVNRAVEISVDDASFANPVAARLSGSAWSVAVPTPAVGKHTIYARSTQGFDTSSPASTTVTVKR